MAGKITVIGAGAVGSTIAYSLTIKGVATKIVLIDINHEKAVGEALDISQGTPFTEPVHIYAGTYADAADSEIVIISSGVARKPGQTRLDLAQTNVNIAKSIIPEITKYAPNAIYVIVANPVDIITYQFYKTSGLPVNQIFGSGTILDTARLRSFIAEHHRVAKKNVHAFVFGEHGDSSFVPWSLANISTIPLSQFKKPNEDDSMINSFNREEAENFVRKSGGKIIERKGVTNYAIATSVMHICDCLDNSIDTALTVSHLFENEYGINDVCMSSLSMVGPRGFNGTLMLPLTDEEIDKLKYSAGCLKDIIKQIDFN